MSAYFEITVFYYNPNIYPEEEYRTRVGRTAALHSKPSGEAFPISFEEGAYDTERFYTMTKGLEDCPEGGERCFRCYELRLREAAEAAKRCGMDYFTTTLSISPLKNAAKLNGVGAFLEAEYGVRGICIRISRRRMVINGLWNCQSSMACTGSIIAAVFSLEESERQGDRSEGAGGIRHANRRIRKENKEE